MTLAAVSRTKVHGLDGSAASTQVDYLRSCAATKGDGPCLDTAADGDCSRGLGATNGDGPCGHGSTCANRTTGLTCANRNDIGCGSRTKVHGLDASATSTQVDYLRSCAATKGDGPCLDTAADGDCSRGLGATNGDGPCGHGSTCANRTSGLTCANRNHIGCGSRTKVHGLNGGAGADVDVDGAGVECHVLISSGVAKGDDFGAVEGADVDVVVCASWVSRALAMLSVKAPPPAAPAGPVAPVAPPGPSGPVRPMGPMGPMRPIGPATPGTPCGPAEPAGPSAPAP